MTRWFLLVFAALFMGATAQAECPVFGQKKHVVVVFYKSTGLLVVKAYGGYVSAVGITFAEREEYQDFALTPQTEEGNWYDPEWGCVSSPWKFVESFWTLYTSVDTSACPEEDTRACLSTGRVRLGWLNQVPEILYARVLDENGEAYTKVRVRHWE